MQDDYVSHLLVILTMLFIIGMASAIQLPWVIHSSFKTLRITLPIIHQRACVAGQHGRRHLRAHSFRCVLRCHPMRATTQLLSGLFLERRVREEGAMRVCRSPWGL